MSKIFERKLAAEAVARYSRQFVVSATGWWNKYRDDPFFRAETNVIVLQITFSLLILGLISASFNLLNRDISTVIATGVEESRLNSVPPMSIVPLVTNDMRAIREQHFDVIVAIVVLMTAIFGYIVARITLAPARNALASQKQFIGNIAHELRTPLSIIKTNTEIALIGNSMSADLKQTLTSNVEELDRISDIINNLLSLSALIRPERVKFTSFDLSEVIDDVVEKYAKLAVINKQEIVIKKSPEAHIMGNMTAIEQIAGNLLKNAINYTPPRGTVVISTAPAPNGFVELSIKDTGIGIPRKDLFRIFEPFYRTDQSRTRARGGTGLGLAIVSELVKLHGGKIAIRSAVGRGTTVSVLFPAVPTPAKVGTSERAEGLNEVEVDFTAKHS